MPRKNGRGEIPETQPNQAGDVSKPKLTRRRLLSMFGTAAALKGGEQLFGAQKPPETPKTVSTTPEQGQEMTDQQLQDLFKEFKYKDFFDGCASIKDQSRRQSLYQYALNETFQSFLVYSDQLSERSKDSDFNILFNQALEKTSARDILFDRLDKIQRHPYKNELTNRFVSRADPVMLISNYGFYATHPDADEILVKAADSENEIKVYTEQTRIVETLIDSYPSYQASPKALALFEGSIKKLPYHFLSQMGPTAETTWKAVKDSKDPVLQKILSLVGVTNIQEWKNLPGKESFSQKVRVRLALLQDFMDGRISVDQADNYSSNSDRTEYFNRLKEIQKKPEYLARYLVKAELVTAPK